MSAERRHDEQDRRIIERVSSPIMIGHLKQIRWLLLTLTIMMGGTAIYNVTTVATLTDMSFGIFLGIIFFTLATAFWRYYSSVLLFLENESHSNLDRVMERQLLVWITLVFFASIYGVAHLLFKS